MFYFISLPVKAFLSARGLFVAVVDNIEDLVLWKTFSKILPLNGNFNGGFTRTFLANTI